MGWDVDGVKGETRSTKLLYSEAAGVVLVQFERDVGRIPLRSLYIRERDANQYRRVYGGDDRRTAHDVVLRTKSTYAFFLVMLKSELTRGGFDIESIGRLDLTTGAVTTALDVETYKKKNEDGWISDLFDIETTTERCSAVRLHGVRPQADRRTSPRWWRGVLAVAREPRHGRSRTDHVPASYRLLNDRVANLLPRLRRIAGERCGLARTRSRCRRSGFLELRYERRATSPSCRLSLAGFESLRRNRRCAAKPLSHYLLQDAVTAGVS